MLLFFVSRYFMVTFPAVIESGSQATFCVSLLKPNETLQMNIYLVHNNETRTLLQETVEEEMHQCSHFEAPQVEGESVQEISVEVEGENFKMTETRKVMFKSYNTLVFIQTDKPIYNPGQTVNFRIVSMDSNFIPLEQKDTNQNRIGQWTNVNSTGLILQLSHQLNAEAPMGDYSLHARTENTLTTHNFKVQKYVLPKFEITVKTPEKHSIGEDELKLEICGKYTYGQPVPGEAVVKVCREFMNNYFHNPSDDAPMISPCLAETVKMSQTGCAFLILNVSTFINSEFEDNLENQLQADITLIEEGTEFSIVKSVIIELTFELGKVELLDLPKTFEREKFIEGKVISKGAIVHHGHKKVEFEESAGVRKGEISFNLSVVVEFAPVVQIVVYSVLPSKNVIAASKNLNVEKCFQNKVSLKFSPSKAVPGEKNTLELIAHPGSLCGLSAVDQSVFILESGNRLDTDKIFNLLPVTAVSDYPYMIEEVQECINVRPRRNAWREQAYNTLKGVGLKMATNLAIRPPHCLTYKGIPYFRGIAYGGPYAMEGLSGHARYGSVLDYEPTETVRKFFPETWIWQMSEVGLVNQHFHFIFNIFSIPFFLELSLPYSIIRVQLPVTVPDTITTWETEAFCVSSVGLGLAPPVQLTVFQPFFLELSLPYSIIRGEVFELKATVFNYLSKCIMVKVTPASSTDYTLEPSSNEYSLCLCANQIKTFKWTLIPTVLGVVTLTVSAEAEHSQTVCDNEIVSVPERGRIDTVTRSLIVQDPVVNKGLLCIKSSLGNMTNIYTTALFAYTFSLAGENEIREQLLKELDNVALSGDGRLHWSQSALDQSSALSVEISSYVLLAILTADELTAADLGYANRIVSWLVKQQNPYGGFSSTQDTVVALQALALYSTKVFSSEGSSTVTVKSADGDSHSFDVTQDNKLLYQESSLKDVPGKYSIDVKGSACASVQTVVFYNIPMPTETNTLSISANTEGNCTKSFGYTLSLNFTVGYNGALNSTNMIIVDIKLLSGFTADPAELQSGIPRNYKLHIKQVLPVKNLKPAQIKVYDYYQTSLILQLSHQLNAEAPEGYYYLTAETENRSITHIFQVKKYVLPKFEVTVKTSEEHSIVEEELKLEVCGKYTFGQPVPGVAQVQVCREFRKNYLENDQMISPCLVETIEMSKTGCALLVYNVSTFLNSKFKAKLENRLNATITLTEEGTELSMVKSVIIGLTYRIGQLEFVNLPKHFERNKFIKGTASVNPVIKYGEYKTPFFSHADASLQLFEPTTPYNPVFSGLSIENLEEPLKCGAEIPITINYYIVGETKENYSIGLVYIVSLQFSPTKAVPGEKNTLELLAHPGSLCGLSAVDQSVFILEPENRLSIKKIFRLLPVSLALGYPYGVEEDQVECLHVRPRRSSWVDSAYNTLKPFFLELSLPYSIIRGEVFELKATVFSYLSKCIMVKVTPAPSSDYTLDPSSDGEYLSCLCANGRKTLKWTLIPAVLGVLNVTVSAEAEQSQTLCDNEIVSVPERGRIDTVTRSLIVKGGVNDDVTMTAYITASLLELGHTVQSAFDDADALSVEISSYVLLAVLTTAELSAADLGNANRIVSWLVKQQNPYGGFSSTQDTVVALQALALYSTKVFSSDGSSTITVTSAGGDNHKFYVHQNNKLLYQERSLKDVPGKYSIAVKGSTCVSVQTALFYNVPTPNETNTLSIVAETEGNCTKSFGQTLSLNFTIKYNGKLNSTNMIIVDIKLLSGFTADPGELKKRILVERIDSKDDRLIMYIEKLPRNIPINYELHIKRVLPVKNLKPAWIKVYDYYQTIHFRIVTMDSNFIPREQKDNNDNRIGQWTNVTSTRLILQLSHELNAEAPLGQYQIIANAEGKLVTHYFEVKKYVLPKFEITVTSPKEHSVGEEELKLEICGRYTYGQPVAGAALVQVCLKLIENYLNENSPMIAPCLDERVEISQNGCASLILNISTLIVSEFEDNFETSLNATITLTEEGTEFLYYDYLVGKSAPNFGLTKTVRKFFPETWIWQLSEVGDSGSVELPVTVPDTITTWETEAFCVSSVGLGLAPPVQLTVFQPFFLELSLPYSIIRGEVFELKATVFNYLSKCIMVKVTPAASTDYTLEPFPQDEYLSCLCANGRKTFKWTLIPIVLGVVKVTVSAEAEESQTLCDNEIVSVPERGRIDTVTRSLIVQAEGIEMMKSQSWLLCPQGNSVSEELQLILPENIIQGSARASVSVLGDILGRALKHLDGLLKMPYGCGEQNIALLAPNIYILQYLENTKQLTAAIRERATGFLKSGYQRQLNYKHINGAYSTFGRGEGNTWLTAFVLRTFGKAQGYIFIDPESINSAKKWLISMQRSDGCFIQQGSLFNNRMKGGVNDDVTITAYIIASFLELGITVQDPVVNNGLLCLKSFVDKLENTYTTALLAYTFSLAGENEIRKQLLKKLDNVVVQGDGRLHWSQSASDDSDALSVEISSYVLLAVLTTGELTAADLGYANRIVSWLVKQQNPYGGFSSTQDTVVALQALALYSTKVFSSDGSSTVTVTSADGDSHNFDVNQNNKLLYQESSLKDVPGKYSIDVKGSTCVSVQTALFFNVPTPTKTSTLSIMAKTEGNCTVSFKQTLSLKFTITYNGALNSTNMIIMDIKLLSGFTADPAELKKGISVERVDSRDDHLIMYIKELTKNTPINYELHMKQVLPVKNLKPAVIKVYDYYQTSDKSETEYTSPCV
ncbi:alpha-2-macroglobulin-like isoform X2 [Silurus asotus]|uniref:Alpha-2-macroglobulin-like isoform X2 n=1 Tax=Silurus asotus TaxID=30991 RepID=A0AAD5BAA4_SILAS|nr:alpha-2-macroglobulin-like isoform X2 [Silurus asotus]